LVGFETDFLLENKSTASLPRPKFNTKMWKNVKNYWLCKKEENEPELS
jgi:hypothetical protein